MKKLILGLCMILALTACKDENKQMAQANTKPVVKIGAILPLSGDLAVWGNSEKQGLILAQENLPTTLKNKYELVIEDSSNANKNIQHLTQKMISVDKVDAIVTMFDPAANIVGPMATTNKIIHFGQSWFPQYVTDEYNYNVYADMKQEAHLIADYLAHKGIKKVYLFTVNQTGFIGGTDILKQLLEEQKIEYRESNFNFGQTDFRTDIVKAGSFNAQAYIIGAFAPEADILTKQLKQINGEDIIITGLDLGLNIANKSLYEGSVFGSPAIPGNSFLSGYKTKYNDENYLFGATVGYISFNAIVHAFENSQTKDKQSVAKFLSTDNNIPTIYDEKIIKDKGLIYIPSELLTIVNDKLVTFEE